MERTPPRLPNMFQKAGRRSRPGGTERRDHGEERRLGPVEARRRGAEFRDREIRARDAASKRADYIRNDHHKASDVPKPDWDLSGAVEDLAVLLEVGYRAAEQPGHQAWKPDAIWRPKAE